MKLENIGALEIHQADSLKYGGHLDLVIIHALLESLFTIFTTMVSMEIEPGIPVPKQGDVARGAVSTLLGMKAEGASGSVSLSFPLPAIREISRRLMGYEIVSVNNEAVDLAGELTNMLVGGAKRILSEKGHDFDMQTPQMLLGEGHKIEHHYAGQTVLLPVRIKQDEFYLELNFV